MGATDSRTRTSAAGVASATAILLVYALFRPESLAFSVPFLIVPSLALLWTTTRDAGPAGRRLALQVTWATAIACALVATVGLVLV